MMRKLSTKQPPELTVIGGGLAGCEAAWQAAQRGVQVKLFEMRPLTSTGAHVTGDLAEIICSNSFGSILPDRASGLLKQELAQLDCLLLHCAQESALPAGGALAVDRNHFSALVTQKLSTHPLIQIFRQEMTEIPAQPAIIATGPLTSSAFARAIQTFTGFDHLFFFDAIAPVVEADSIDMTIAYRASRYGKGASQEGDYINCPMNREQYYAFVAELLKAERIPLREFETEIINGVRAGLSTFFEGCLPIEIIAQRNIQSLAYGPLRPVGLHHPVTGDHAYAILQLRQDNLAGTLYNLVGFQTNLTYAEQKRVFRMIPGLQNAEFARFGQMHRNTFIASPLLLHPSLQSRPRADLFFAGQITGVEGYMGNIASGWLAGVNAARSLNNQELIEFPRSTMLGALFHYVTHASLNDFQPAKAAFGLLPELEQKVLGRRMRAAAYRARAEETFTNFLNQQPDLLSSQVS